MKKEHKELSISERFSLIRDAFSLTAGRLGEIAGVSGTAIAKIESGETANPKADVLASISTKLQINLNWLVLGEGEMLKVTESPNSNSVLYGSELYIQPDTKGNVQAPLINYKAAANYLAGYQSNEYYEELEAITLPKHMAKGAQPVKGFYLTGDSMEPTFYADDIAVCQQVPRGEWRLLKEETVAVVVSNSRGLQLKRVTVRPSLGTLRCQSDNPHSPVFDLSIDEDVLELWRFEWLLTKRCEKANQDLPEWRRHMENEVGDLRYLLEQVLDKKELQRIEALRTS